MTKLLTAAALAAISLAVPTMASAQALGAAVIATVDTDRVVTECNACRTANAQLQQQVAQARQLAQQLQGPINTEGTALQKLVAALNGKQPDAALQARIRAFDTQQNSADQQLQQRQQLLQSTQAHINQQIGTKVGPIVNSVMAARGINVVLAKGATLGASPSIDVTNDVLTQLNQQLTTISVTPLPQQAAPAAAPAAPAAPPRPATPGR